MLPALLIDLVIAATVLEAVLLIAWHRRSGGGVAPVEVLPNLASGLALMLALRAVIHGAGWGWIATALAASGALHAADLKRRWQPPR